MMKPADALSRGLPTPELNTDFSVNLSDSPSLDALMNLCNPTLVHFEEDFHTSLLKLNDLIYQFEIENI